MTGLQNQKELWVPPLALGMVLLLADHGVVGAQYIPDLGMLSWTFPVLGMAFGMMTLAGLVLLGMAVVVVVSSSEDLGSNTTAGTLASGIRAGAFVGIIAILYYYYTASFDGLGDAVSSLWWVAALGVVGYMMFIYLQHRQNVASASTAIDHTQRTVSRNLEGYGQLVVGTVALVLAAILAVLQGALTGAAQLGEPLLGFAGEIAYLGSVFIGYASLGGEWYGSWLVPDLTAFQFAMIALMMGGIALVVRNR